MSQKWKVMCIIWVVCGAVSILTGDSGVMLMPTIGTLLAAFHKSITNFLDKKI